MTDEQTLAAHLISTIWAEWQRVFGVATSPVLIPVRVVAIPTEIAHPKPIALVFASDADFGQINHWRNACRLNDVQIDITFNGYVNQNFGNLRLTGFSAVQYPSGHQGTGASARVGDWQ